MMCAARRGRALFYSAGTGAPPQAEHVVHVHGLLIAYPILRGGLAPRHRTAASLHSAQRLRLPFVQRELLRSASHSTSSVLVSK